MSSNSHLHWAECVFMCVLVISIAACTAYRDKPDACGKFVHQSKGESR